MKAVLGRSEIIDGSASDYFKERSTVRKLQTAHIKPTYCCVLFLHSANMLRVPLWQFILMLHVF